MAGEPALELVLWRDAYFDIQDGEEREDFVCETVGWVSLSPPHYLRVAGESTPTGDRSVTHIPLVCVIARMSLQQEEL